MIKISNIIFRSLHFSLVLLLPFCVTAQVVKKPMPIHLKSGDITPVANVATWFSERSATVYAEPVQVLIHFDKLPDKAERDLMAANGITLYDYVPENTFTAIIKNKPSAARLEGLPMQSIVNMIPDWKADNYIWNKAANEKGTMKLMVSLYPSAGKGELKAFIGSLGGQLEAGNMEGYGYYNVSIPAYKLRNLAGWYAVRYVSPYSDMVLLDKQSIPAVKGNNAIAPLIWGGDGLNGDGVTIGVGDNTSGVFHTDVADRVVNFNPAQVTNHGIHINCITGGAAILDPLAQSMTPNVSLVNFLFSNVLSATGAMLQDHNMTITNNSYTVMADACDYFGTYDLYSRFLDTLAIQFPVVQHVFAAGNDGELTCGPYAPGYATMGGGYQPAKNNIVVGSVTHNLEQAWDQSRGPVRDGRMKPDIVAVGASVYSGLRYDTYGWAGGTSMASPQTTSGLAILTQRYKQLFAGAQPRADLLKTVLLNGAMDLGNPGPDYSYGYGVMDIGRSLEILNANHYISNDISNGDEQSFTITVPAGMGQVKVLLCWNDIPASPGAARQLINDLDVIVTTPGAAVHLPLGLDGAVANIQLVAVEKPDHLNNTEQVTINNPAAGTYTIKVKGYSIPFGPQHYVVAYDMVPKQLALTFPKGGEALSNNDTIRVFWNALPDGNTFKVEFSPDNGVNWILIADNIPAWAHYCPIWPEGVNSGRCRVRVTRNGTAEVATSERFVINEQPVARLYDSQCPGYLNMHWQRIPGADAYQVMKKIGAHMQVVDTVFDTTYSYSGLSFTQRSIVAVQPMYSGVSGYRSIAIATVANSGDCLNPVSNGDLAIEKMVSPASGRLLTSTAPGGTSTLSLQVRNLYAAACSNYTIYYRINGGAWVAVVNPGIVIPANSSVVIDIPGLSVSLPGSYEITAVVQNTSVADPQTANDTITTTIKCVPNDPLDLTGGFLDDFETMGKISTSHDTIGVSPNGCWDYFNDDDSGRMRSYVFDEVVIGGNRSISMDQIIPMRQGSRNSFEGTFNLSGYDTSSDEVRVDFDYVLHGTPAGQAGNSVHARANDLQAWSPFFNYDLTSYPGFAKRALSLSLTDAVRAGSQNFSTSTQIAFGQNDSSLIAGYNYGNGMTIDNFRMYTVFNDAALAEIVSPQPNNCGLPATIPLEIKVRNGVNNTLYNVAVHYSMDSGTVYSGVIDSVGAKKTVYYTFPQLLDIGLNTTHKLNVWLSAPGDSYLQNDSVLLYEFRNSKIIAVYPFLEDFESGDGGFYSGGFLSSWQYGTPSSARINKAASGTKAWKTNLGGVHNSLEKSYLYSPCFDISQLTNPVLSFSMAQDLENCGGVLCDGAYMEYSFDGTDWVKLGAPGIGFNWYDSSFSVWNTIGFTRWHVATTPLPVPPAGKVLHLRFVLFGDPAVNLEGLAIDDIHIYDYVHPIAAANGIKSVTENLAAGQWNDFLSAGGYLASLMPDHVHSNTTVTLYEQQQLANPGQTQYTFPRSYLIGAEEQADGSTAVRLYLEDDDVVAVLNDTACPSCTPVIDAYSLGITGYHNGNNPATNNGSLADDTGGSFIFLPYSMVQWVPYDRGYRATFDTRQFSEFWFSNGGPTRNFPAGIDYLNFLAFKSGDAARVYWYSLIDTAVASYILERSDDGKTFEQIFTKDAANAVPGTYNYEDAVSFATLPERYYRLQWTMKGRDQVYYSPVRKLTAGDSAAGLVQFHAAMASSRHVLADWRSFIDGLVDHYILERAIGNGAYTLLENRASQKVYGQQYFFTDAPGTIPQGTPIHYKLTAVLGDGTSIVLPVRTVSWVEESAIVAIFPNPTHDGTFTIKWNADPGTEMQLELMDITGKRMEQATFTATSWDNSTTIQTARRPRGVYVLRMVVGGYRHTARIVFD